MGVTLYLVRHGEAASSWDEDPDPGLSDRGAEQARQAANSFSTLDEPVRLLSSPLKRACETAQPLETQWGQKADIVPQISEIPSRHVAFSERRAWLNDVMAGHWADQEDVLLNWRAAIIDCLQQQKENAVLFTHFMVINAVVGHVEGADKVLLFRPDNASITRISLNKGELSLIERGREAITVIR